MNTILLVEDDPACAAMLRTALNTFGHQVVLAPDGKQALRLFDPQSMNVAVVDLMMPEMDGMELIMRLQEREPGVRVIAMTGGGRGKPEAYLRMAERLGAVKSLAKPFPLEALRQAVGECLDA
ncbi:MAG: response regulator receiver [Limisphaerales bacterium]|nr:MAG: response regulator receiver [Limisphaerales bacterium]TXT48388.1 MAG: response regulator receiver [Limisphaerales bacterium]